MQDHPSWLEPCQELREPLVRQPGWPRPVFVVLAFKVLLARAGGDDDAFMPGRAPERDENSAGLPAYC